MTLSSDLTSDLDVFFDTDDFGISVTAHAGNVFPDDSVTNSAINVIWGEAYIEVGGVDSLRPTAAGKTSDMTGIVHNSKIVKDGANYKVVSVQPDSTGVTVLILEAE